MKDYPRSTKSPSSADIKLLDSSKKGVLLYQIQVEESVLFARLTASLDINLSGYGSRIETLLRKTVKNSIRTCSSHRASKTRISAYLDSISTDRLFGDAAKSFLITEGFNDKLVDRVSRSERLQPIKRLGSSIADVLTYGTAFRRTYHKLVQQWHTDENVLRTLESFLITLDEAGHSKHTPPDIQLTLFTPDTITEAISSRSDTELTTYFPPSVIKELSEQLLQELQTLAHSIKNKGGLVAVWTQQRLPRKGDLSFAQNLSHDLSDAVINRASGVMWLSNNKIETIEKTSTQLESVTPIEKIYSLLEDPNACLVLHIDDPEQQFIKYQEDLNFGTRQQLRRDLARDSSKTLTSTFWLSTTSAIKAAGITFD